MADRRETDEAADERQIKGSIGSASIRSSTTRQTRPSLLERSFGQRQVHALRAQIEKKPTGAAS
jgi:hypothetical protein